MNILFGWPLIGAALALCVWHYNNENRWPVLLAIVAAWPWLIFTIIRDRRRHG